MGNINVFKERNETWIIVKTAIVSVLLGLVITFGVSLICGFRYDIVVSYSMYPTLTRGTMVVIEPTAYEDLEIGDIVNFDFASTTCTHRLVGFAEDGDLITQGDAATSQEKIPESKYRGRIVFYDNIVGPLILLIRENILLFGIVSIIILLVYACV